MLLTILLAAASTSEPAETPQSLDRYYTEIANTGLAQLNDNAAKARAEGKWPDKAIGPMQSFQLRVRAAYLHCTAVALKTEGILAEPTDAQIDSAMGECPSVGDAYARTISLAKLMSNEPTPAIRAEVAAQVRSYIKDHSNTLKDTDKFASDALNEAVRAKDTSKKAANVPDKPSTAEIDARVHAYLVNYLKDPLSAQVACGEPSEWGWIKESIVHPKKYGYIVQCQINAKNGFGGYTGVTPDIFVFNGERLTHIPQLMAGWKYKIGG